MDMFDRDQADKKARMLEIAREYETQLLACWGVVNVVTPYMEHRLHEESEEHQDRFGAILARACHYNNLHVVIAEAAGVQKAITNEFSPKWSSESLYYYDQCDPEALAYDLELVGKLFGTRVSEAMAKELKELG